MSHTNNNVGRQWSVVQDPGWGEGGYYIEVRETDKMGDAGELLASFYMKPDETEEEAIRAALEEAFNPLAPWEADYAHDTREILVWLAEALGIDTEEYRR